MWSKVWDNAQREAYVKNVSGNLGNVKKADIKARQRMSHILSPRSLSMLTLSFVLVAIYAAVDQDLSDRIAKAIGHPSVKPLQVKSAAEVLKFRTNIGVAVQ